MHAAPGPTRRAEPRPGSLSDVLAPLTKPMTPEPPPETQDPLAEAYEIVKETNEALQERLKARWTFFQAVLALVAFLFAVNFAYQVVRTSEIMSLKVDAERALEKAEIREEAAYEAAAEQAETLADLSSALAHLNRSLRETTRGRYRDASTACKAATDILENRLQSKATGPPEDHPGLHTPRAVIQKAVKHVLVSAYESHGRVGFKLGDGQLLVHVGNKLVELAPDRAGGYHYRGIGRMNLGKYDDDVAKDLRTAALKDPKTKIDYCNLMELYFVREDYGYCLESAARYIEEERSLAPELRLIFSFYVSASTLLAPESIDSLTLADSALLSPYDILGTGGRLLEAIQKDPAIEMVGGNLANIFDGKVLRRRRIELNRNDDREMQVAETIDWLTGRG